MSGKKLESAAYSAGQCIVSEVRGPVKIRIFGKDCAGKGIMEDVEMPADGSPVKTKQVFAGLPHRVQNVERGGVKRLVRPN